jgi:hypothetical protein
MPPRSENEENAAPAAYIKAPTARASLFQDKPSASRQAFQPLKGAAVEPLEELYVLFENIIFD